MMTAQLAVTEMRRMRVLLKKPQNPRVKGDVWRRVWYKRKTKQPVGSMGWKGGRSGSVLWCGEKYAGIGISRCGFVVSSFDINMWRECFPCDNAGISEPDHLKPAHKLLDGICGAPEMPPWSGQQPWTGCGVWLCRESSQNCISSSAVSYPGFGSNCSCAPERAPSE